MASVVEVPKWGIRPVDLSFLCEFSLQMAVLLVKIEKALAQVEQAIVCFADLLLQLMIADVFREVSRSLNGTDHGCHQLSCCRNWDVHPFGHSWLLHVRRLLCKHEAVDLVGRSRGTEGLWTAQLHGPKGTRARTRSEQGEV